MRDKVVPRRLRGLRFRGSEGRRGARGRRSVGAHRPCGRPGMSTSPLGGDRASCVARVACDRGRGALSCVRAARGEPAGGGLRRKVRRRARNEPSQGISRRRRRWQRRNRRRNVGAVRMVLPRVLEASQVSGTGRRGVAVGGTCGAFDVPFGGQVGVQGARPKSDVAQWAREGGFIVQLYHSGGHLRRRTAGVAVAGRRGRGACRSVVGARAAIVGRARRAAREGNQMGARLAAGARPSSGGRRPGSARSWRPAAARAGLRQGPRDGQRVTDSSSAAQEVKGAADDFPPRLQPRAACGAPGVFGSLWAVSRARLREGRRSRPSGVIGGRGSAADSSPGTGPRTASTALGRRPTPPLHPLRGTWQPATGRGWGGRQQTG